MDALRTDSDTEEFIIAALRSVIFRILAFLKDE